MNRKEFIDRMISAVQEIPVHEIIGQEMKLVRAGASYKGLCPFHADNHIGSFVVTPAKGIWKCFACGEGGTGIDFIKKFKEMSFLEAVFYIAVQHGIISKAEYDRYSVKAFDQELLSYKASWQSAQVQELSAEHRADADVIHYIYTAFCQMSGLTEEHKQHLLKTRGLEKSHLIDFFSFPGREEEKNVIQKMKKAVWLMLIREVGYSREEYDQLAACEDVRIKILQKKFRRIMDQWIYVPGFYGDNTGVHMMHAQGIGFLICDQEHRACGIQIRRDECKEGESRYIWFSSAFAQSHEDFSGGNSSKSPGGVIFPQIPKANALCITEGRFKAEQISRLGNTAIYVSGVSTWKSILPLVRNVKNGRKTVFLMFDADMLGNTAVHKQLQSLATALSKEHVEPSLLLWSKSRGKGFDDFLLNEGITDFVRYMRRVSFQDFETVYQNVVSDLLDKFGVSAVRYLKKEHIREFEERLQVSVESRLGLLVSPVLQKPELI